MAIVIAIFLLYIFFPAELKKSKQKNIRINNPKGHTSIPVTEISNSPKDGMFFEIRKIMKTYFNEINTGDRDISIIPAKELENVLISTSPEKLKKDIGRSLKYRFRDMNRVIKILKESDISDINKFDLYIALFLIKIYNEDIISRSINLSSGEIISLLNLKPYSLVKNEVSENYHSIPIIIYADILINKTDIFSPGKEINFFLNSISLIGDISPMQHINSIKDAFSLTSELRKFSFDWIEKDIFNTDDEGSYKNVTVRRRKFLKLQYIVFPDSKKYENSTWIKDLLNADSGSIELSDLKITDETPGENYSAKSLIYSKSTSRFVIIMDSPSFVSIRGYTALMIKKKIEKINSGNIVINFAEKLYSEKKFRTKLNSFGKFIYSIRSVF